MRLQGRRSLLISSTKRAAELRSGPYQAARKPNGRDCMEGEPSIRDASHLYEVEHHAEHAARSGFRITELQLSPTQRVPWHSHTNISDTFYVLSGHMRLFLNNPKQEVNLNPGDVFVAKPERPHMVTNGGTTSLVFLVLQGMGEYDYVPLRQNS
jgi:mannose-6-phosphate isomerase-like protein (cupin superfamily)